MLILIVVNKHNTARAASCWFIIYYRLVMHGPWTSTCIQDLFHPNSWQTPVAAVTVYSAPDDGSKGRPKHVEHTCSFFNAFHTVVLRFNLS